LVISKVASYILCVQRDKRLSDKSVRANFVATFLVRVGIHVTFEPAASDSFTGEEGWISREFVAPTPSKSEHQE
jgi:hypothetical protein